MRGLPRETGRGAWREAAGELLWAMGTGVDSPARSWDVATRTARPSVKTLPTIPKAARRFPRPCQEHPDQNGNGSLVFPDGVPVG